MPRRVRTRRFPADDDRCGWWRLLPEAGEPRRLESSERVACVVLGAGFSGLAIARRLAELRPDWRIAVLEAQRAGYSASGRNSGFAGEIAHRNPDEPFEDTLRAKRLCAAGIESLRSLVQKHEIECSWIKAGRIHAAVERRGLRNFDTLLRLLERAEEPHTVLDQDVLADSIGTRHYKRGVHIRSTVLVQPAALARGLAACLPDNVLLFEASPVAAMERNARWSVRTSGGRVEADRVFLATNGFLPGLGVSRRRLFPLYTFASLTRPLTAGEQRHAGRLEQWGLVSEDRMGSTLRRTADQRLLVRCCVRYSPSLRIAARELGRIREQHRKSLRMRWPALEGVDFEYTWGGVMGVSINQGQLFGRLDEGLYASAGYNGTGVAMGTACGRLLGEHALDLDSSLLHDALALPRPGWVPPDPLLGWGVRATTAYLHARAGAER